MAKSARKDTLNELASLNVDENDNQISKEPAIRVVPRFGISEEEADTMVTEILGTVSVHKNC